MTYIILAAGRGENLKPLTTNLPKILYKLNDKYTILQKSISNIRKYDPDAEIVAVVGFQHKEVEKALEDENVIFIVNPFFDVTNSVASLWFAKSYLERENVTILHGDVLFESTVYRNFICKDTKQPLVLIDKSVKQPNAYNVAIEGNRVQVMSKKINDYDAKYASVSKLDAVSARLVKDEICEMILGGTTDSYFEDSLVQMIMFKDFELSFVDISKYAWTSIDYIDDLLKAKELANK